MLSQITSGIEIVTLIFVFLSLLAGIQEGWDCNGFFCTGIWTLTAVDAHLWLWPCIPILVIKVLIALLGVVCVLVLICYAITCWEDGRLDRESVSSLYYYLGTLLISCAWFFTL